MLHFQDHKTLSLKIIVLPHSKIQVWKSTVFNKNMGFPGGSDGKESACNVGDLGSIPELGRSPGEGKGYPLQYSCLENPTDRRARQATVHGVPRVRHHLATKPPQ